MRVMPFQTLKANHLIVGNCVDELYEIPANSIDLTVTQTLMTSSVTAMGMRLTRKS